MRLVLDTNIALSGLLWDGVPGQLIAAAQNSRIELISSVSLLHELQGVMSRDKFAKQLIKRGLTVKQLFDGYAALVEIVVPAVIEPVIIEDPADDWVLATALAARAQLIVSGDAHLLGVKVFKNIQIVTAVRAIERVGIGYQ